MPGHRPVGQLRDRSRGRHLYPAGHRPPRSIDPHRQHRWRRPRSRRRLVQEWGDQFDDAFIQWLDLLADLRPLVLARIPDAEQRRRLFETWSEPRYLEQLRREGCEAVREVFLADFEALALASDHSV